MVPRSEPTPSAALLYHAATKYRPQAMGVHPGLDWERKPESFRSYASRTKIPLPDASHRSSRGHLDLATIGAWIHATYGVTAVIPRSNGSLHLRAAPSAGGLFPAEIHVVVRTGGTGLPPGLYGYVPTDHALAVLRTGDEISPRLDAACFGNAAVTAAPVCLIVSGIFARSSWRYRDRAYRRVLLDTGHLLGNAVVAATALGLRLHHTGAFQDLAVADLLEADLETEGPLAVAALNLPGRPERPSWTVLPSPSGLMPAGEAIAAIHQASCLGAERPHPRHDAEERGAEDDARFAPAVPIDLPWPVAGHPLADDPIGHILTRRSTRTFCQDSISLADLAAMLAGVHHGPRFGLDGPVGLDPWRISTFLAVTAVDGLEAGVYHLSPHGLQLRHVRQGLTRSGMAYLCLGQDLGRDAAVTIIHTADLGRAVSRMGDRAYRSLHLDAGMIGERLNLAALALGLGASGIGGFFDDQVNAMLGIPEQEAVLYLTTIGRPA